MCQGVPKAVQEGLEAVPVANCEYIDAGKDINNVVREEREIPDASLEDSEGCHVLCHTDNSHKLHTEQTVQKFRNCFHR